MWLWVPVVQGQTLTAHICSLGFLLAAFLKGRSAWYGLLIRLWHFTLYKNLRCLHLPTSQPLPCTIVPHNSRKDCLVSWQMFILQFKKACPYAQVGVTCTMRPTPPSSQIWLLPVQAFLNALLFAYCNQFFAVHICCQLHCASALQPYQSSVTQLYIHGQLYQFLLSNVISWSNLYSFPVIMRHPMSFISTDHSSRHQLTLGWMCAFFWHTDNGWSAVSELVL